MTSITATTGSNPLVQPLNTGDESQRVVNTTRNSSQDNVAARAPEATDTIEPRNNSQSSTEPQQELNRSNDPQTQSRSPEVRIPEFGDRVEVSPGEDNVSSGDRSDNSVTVTISGPNDEEFSSTITREDVFQRVDQQQQAQNLERFVEANQNANDEDLSDDNDLTDSANLIRTINENSDSPEEARETTFDLVETKQQAENAEFAFEQFEQANDSDDDDDSTSNSASTFTELANEANDAQTRNVVIANFAERQTAEERLGVNLDATA